MIFSKKNDPEKVKKWASKVAHNRPKPFYFTVHGPKLIFHIMKSRDQTSVLFSVLCTLYLSKNCKRMFTQSKFTPAQQKTRKTNKRCTLLCVLCALYLSKEVYKNVYKIYIQFHTPKISSLRWKTKQSWENSAQCALCTSYLSKKYVVGKNV